MITVYHHCLSYACGSVFQLGELAFWWAEVDQSGAWRFRFAGPEDLRHRAELEHQISTAARLDLTPAQAAAAAQDARAEAPDV